MLQHRERGHRRLSGAAAERIKPQSHPALLRETSTLSCYRAIGSTGSGSNLMISERVGCYECYLGGRPTPTTDPT